jgi:riboflavin synthase alpha subunit
LHDLQPGAHVNLEFDIVAKYVERMLHYASPSIL